jgi:putative Holliday junction resolvase
VDFGFKRIGLAVTESEVGLPAALPAIAASGALRKDASKIVELARQKGAIAIVLGLPVEEDGEEGRMAKICRQLGDLIQGLGLAVHFVDEGLTSVTAESQMREAGLKASLRKRRRDGEAAALILERFLNESKNR